MNFGGEEEDRTPDLCIANAALSQLSYFPEFDLPRPPGWNLGRRERSGIIRRRGPPFKPAGGPWLHCCQEGL